MKLRKRVSISDKKVLLIALVALGISISLFSILFVYADVDILEGYSILFERGFGTEYIWRTFRRFIPLFLLGLAFLVPAKAKLWNVGGYGQFALGATGAVAITYFLGDLSSGALIPIMAIVSMVVGVAWAFIPAYINAKWDVNEIVTTIMFNYIAIQIVKYLTIGGPLQEPGGAPRTEHIPSQAYIPEIAGTNVPWTIIIPFILAVLLIFFFKKTSLGFEIEAVGASFPSAEYMGVNYTKVVVLTFVVGGALAGLAGFSWLTTTVGYVEVDIIPTWGYMAIAFGLFAALNIAATLLYSFVITGILVGADLIMRLTPMRSGVPLTMIGIIFIVTTALQVFRIYEVKIRG